MDQISLDWGPPRQLYSVSELTAAVREALANSFRDIWVTGEISGMKQVPSGHLYFTLKDAQSVVRGVCYRGTLRFMRFKPQEGMAVVARGRLDVYEPRGEYQLIVDSLEPQGLGALQLAFEQLKRKLEAEGLLEAARKRPLPRYPWRIGIVTSPSGAVIQDILHILARRFSGLHIRLYPAQVQGAGSVEQVVEAIRYFSRSEWAEVVIVCRGGGSLEDLWTFNEEAVARAIATCAVPVISAIGHETDFTIADFVADLRAPAPSAAAEMVIRTRAEIEEQVAGGRGRLDRSIRYRLAVAARRVHVLGIERASNALARRIGKAAQRTDEMVFRLRDLIRARLGARRRQLDHLEATLHRRDPRVRLGEAGRRLDAAHAALVQAMSSRLGREHQRLTPVAAAVKQMSPLRILERGYSIATDAEGTILRDVTQTSVGDKIRVRLGRGTVGGTVTDVTG